MHRHHRATPVAGQRRPLLHLQPTPCAHWLSEYARWHAAHRHEPGAEYLVYTCRPFMPGTNPRCLGFGDRFRIIAYLLRLAAYRRQASAPQPSCRLPAVTETHSPLAPQVLLVDWLSPVPLSDFFEPTDLGSTRIEWRVTAEEAAALRDVPVNRWNGPAPGGDEFWSSGRQYTRVTGNTHWSSDLGRIAVRAILAPLVRSAPLTAPPSAQSQRIPWRARRRRVPRRLARLPYTRAVYGHPLPERNRRGAEAGTLCRSAIRRRAPPPRRRRTWQSVQGAPLRCAVWSRRPRLRTSAPAARSRNSLPRPLCCSRRTCA